MLQISELVRDFILSQPPGAQQEILQALDAIEANPLLGEYLPFPYNSGTIGYWTQNYLIKYRLRDDDTHIGNVARMPTADDIRQAFEQRPPR